MLTAATLSGIARDQLKIYKKYLEKDKRRSDPWDILL